MITGIVAGGSVPSGGGSGSFDDIVLAQTGLFAYYKCNEAPGATAVLDSSGNDRHLTVISGGITLGATALDGADTSTDFDGTGTIACTSGEFDTALAAAFDGDKAVTILLLLELDALGPSVPVHLGYLGIGATRQGLFVETRPAGAVRMQYYDNAYNWRYFDTANGVLATGTKALIGIRRAVGGDCSILVNDNAPVDYPYPGGIAMAAGGLRITLGALGVGSLTNSTNGRMAKVAIVAGTVSDSTFAALAAAASV